MKGTSAGQPYSFLLAKVGNNCLVTALLGYLTGPFGRAQLSLLSTISKCRVSYKLEVKSLSIIFFGGPVSGGQHLSSRE